MLVHHTLPPWVEKESSEGLLFIRDKDKMEEVNKRKIVVSEDEGRLRILCGTIERRKSKEKGNGLCFVGGSIVISEGKSSEA